VIGGKGVKREAGRFKYKDGQCEDLEGMDNRHVELLEWNDGWVED
jgi:hypothetical protein